MNQSINTDSKNSKEPQQKYRLGTVSIKILGGFITSLGVLVDHIVQLLLDVAEALDYCPASNLGFVV